MKNIWRLILVLAWLSMGCSVSWAGVLNSKHDMKYMGKGTDPNVCSYCHTPHNAAGEKIWSKWGNSARLTSGSSSDIGNMCYTCHDGTATNLGQSTVFNASLQQHKTEIGKDCNICHSVHDNTNGKFLNIIKTQGPASESATYCETCHSGAMYSGAEHYGDHTAGIEHPYKDNGAVLNDSCNSCHKMHGAANYTTSELTNPILKMANTNSAYCASCHPNEVQSASGDKKHPANLSSAGTWGKLDCSTCHDPHQTSASGRLAILINTNVDSSYCVTCHQASGTSNGPAIGAHTHPVGSSVNFTTVGSTPSARDIDDNSNGQDYPNNSASLVCETCHSVHLKGVDSHALRITASSGALCKNCHSDK